jgi:hypothetical protein
LRRNPPAVKDNAAERPAFEAHVAEPGALHHRRQLLGPGKLCDDDLAKLKNNVARFLESGSKP